MSMTECVLATCASNQADFEVRSSDGTRKYTVSTYGPESEMGCTCPAGQHGRPQCKHRDYIVKYACLRHPQAGYHGPATVRPKAYHFTGYEFDDKCPNCGGPTYIVKYLI